MFISGRMQTRKWQDKEGGTRYTTEIVAREMKRLDSRGGGDRSGSAGADGSAPPMGDDSVPF